jgi:hypothetical protein
MAREELHGGPADGQRVEVSEVIDTLTYPVPIGQAMFWGRPPGSDRTGMHFVMALYTRLDGQFHFDRMLE